MQNRITDQAAFILHQRDYQESSLILELFTEDYGRLSVLVKGAKKRRDVAHFQLCNRLSVGWSGRGELKILTQIESKSIPVPSKCYIAVFYINELLLTLLPKQDEYPYVFYRYQLLLLGLNQQTIEPLLRSFELDLLTELGFLPDLACVSSNGSRLESDQRYHVDDVSGVYPVHERDVRSYSGAELVAVAQRRFDSDKTLKVAKRLLRQIIDYKLQGRTLQSRKFYQQFFRQWQNGK